MTSLFLAICSSLFLSSAAVVDVGLRRCKASWVYPRSLLRWLRSAAVLGIRSPSFADHAILSFVSLVAMAAGALPRRSQSSSTLAEQQALFDPMSNGAGKGVEGDEVSCSDWLWVKVWLTAKRASV